MIFKMFGKIPHFSLLRNNIYGIYYNLHTNKIKKEEAVSLNNNMHN